MRVLVVGQSNALGYFSACPAGVSLPDLPPNLLYWDGSWNEIGVNGAGNLFGPEVGIAEELNDGSVVMAKVAIAGEPISTFMPGTSAFSQILSLTLDTNCFLAWSQGESDSMDATLANSYSASFASLLQAIKTQTQCSNLKVVSAMLKVDTQGQMAYMNTVNQALIANSDAMISTSTLTFSDTIHYDCASTLTRGRDFATQFEALGFNSR